ncbi:MAG: hypothetical protein ABSA13_17485 [Beijerinckiaceae bacterium]
MSTAAAPPPPVVSCTRIAVLLPLTSGPTDVPRHEPVRRMSERARAYQGARWYEVAS